MFNLSVFRGPPTFNPATLTLSGWWRASYSGAPWSGTASAGSSGSKSFTHVSTDPATGTSLNGLTVADCSGGGKQLSDTSDAMNSLVSVGGYTVAILFKANSASAPSGGSTPYGNPAFISDTTGGAYFGVGFNTSGVVLYHLTGGIYQSITVAASTGSYHLAIGRYDGTNMKLRVDSGSDTTSAQGNIDSAVGGSTNHIRFEDTFTGPGTGGVDAYVAELMFAQSDIGSTNCTNIKQYVNARYGLSL